ncbi:unnamed protein product [Brassicogethes aeneus]|uniref:Uncharacterized protein n=1 Tax=Brassicogethes aeneus TaxID=1431903 RepID=A0A9P0AS60_BRAAE|nr:unnamed protein product [Brassicogethes aeneus]
MECSVGKIVGEVCHKTKIFDFESSFSDEDKDLLRIRVGQSIENICIFHKDRYLTYYSTWFGKSCCDPFKRHKSKIKKSLCILGNTFCQTQKNIHLVPGNAICLNCLKKLKKFKDGDNEEDWQDNNDSIIIDDIDDDFIPPEELKKEVSEICKLLRIEEIGLSSTISKKAIEKKACEVKLVFKKKCLKVLNLSDSEEEPDDDEMGRNYISLVKEIKETIPTLDYENKINIISLAPKSWSLKRVASEFNISEKTVRTARNLSKEHGIFPKSRQINLKGRPSISEEVHTTVLDFYQQDDVSRLCPGAKEFTSVRDKSGKKVHKQKRLLLFNLKELFLMFKEEKSYIKIGFSKFCALRPKWCVLAGGAGTHTVCVCLYHQNLKLLCNVISKSVKYTTFIEATVCDVNNENCMFGECKECPGKQKLEQLLSEMVDDGNKTVVYNQWISTDRCHMKQIQEKYSEFLETFKEQVLKTKEHHFVAKSQGAFLKQLKESLGEGEFIVLCDFAENYSFTVQDEVQSFHWNTSSATLHPFLIYYKDISDTIQTQSFCVLSDVKNHTTLEFAVFQKYFIQLLKTRFLCIKKLFYMTYGCAGQYKNKKNFLNLYYHEEDYLLEAEWHFFGTSHGKSACDGVGGTVKRVVRKTSLQRTSSNQILDIDSMFNFCHEYIKGISFLLIKQEKLDIEKDFFDKRFQLALPIKNTRAHHGFIPQKDNLLKIKKYSNSNLFTIVKVQK